MPIPIWGLIWGGVVLAVLGVVLTYTGTLGYRPNDVQEFSGAAFPLSWVRAEVWLRRIGFVSMGLAFVLAGLAVLLAGTGWYVTIPGVIVGYAMPVVIVMCAFIGCAGLCAWTLLRHTMNKRTQAVR